MNQEDRERGKHWTSEHHASECDRLVHVDVWEREPAGESEWYSERERAYYDLFHENRRNRIPHERGGRTEDGSPVDLNTVLTDAVWRSRTILSLNDDWDEQGSPGYSEQTWKRAIQFLLRNVTLVWRRHRVPVPVPRILPGPEGSIDLHWRTPARELLINIPASPEEAASYYGDDIEEGTESAIRGKGLDTNADSEWILLWLTK
jgi:hypothetical protein